MRKHRAEPLVMFLGLRLSCRMTRLTITVGLVVALLACGKKTDNSTATTGQPVAPGANLTVGAVCKGFCDKLCGTCGDTSCQDTCKPRCFNGRAESMVMDGKDPKVALEFTQTKLDACTTLITKDSCPGIMAGQVPPACFTIQR